MPLADKLNGVKDNLNKLKKDRRYKKANLKREEVVELQTALAKCNGQLNLCIKDFEWTIRNQAKNIQEGNRSHADVAIQEQILWDAAIGYMLVKDAMYSLKTVNSSNSISYGYEMLDVAIAQMNGKKKKLPTYGLGSSKKFRNRYGYITSDAVKDEKVEMLEGFFEELKVTGDIEACLAKAQGGPAITTNGVASGNGAVDKTSPEYLSSILGGAAPVINDDDIDINDIDTL